LLQFVNKDRVEYSRQSSRKFIEAPLLEQLNMDKEFPRSSSEFSHDVDLGSHRPHEQRETGKSLPDFLYAQNIYRSHSRLKGLSDVQEQAEVEDECKSLHYLLNEETKDKNKNAKYHHLYRLQLQLEVESTEEAVRKHLEVWNSARNRSDHETIPAFRRALDSWFAPLTEAIELEQWLYLNDDYKTCSYSHLSLDGDNGQLSSIPDSDDVQDDAPERPRSVKDRSMYGPLLCLLPPRKIAVLLAHTASSRSLADRDGKSKVVSLALQIAEVLEMEVNVSRALRVRAGERKRKVNSLNMGEGDDSNHSDAGFEQSKTPPHKELDKIDDQLDDDPIDRWVYSASHLQRFLDEISGGSPAGEQNSLKGMGRVRPGIVRKRCKEILRKEGFISEEINEKGAHKQLPTNAFAEWDPVKKVKLGAALLRLLLDHTKYSKPSRADSGNMTPEPAFRYVSNKNSNGKTQGCISIHPDLYRIAVQEELSLTSMHIPLSELNDRVQPMIVPPKKWTDINNGGYETIKVPFMRTKYCKTQKVSSMHVLF
jgi:DNA-directed RNA polymerase